RYAHGAQRAAKRSKYGGEPSWWNQRISGDIVACAVAAHMGPRMNPQGYQSEPGARPGADGNGGALRSASLHLDAALHQRQVAREAAEEHVRAAVTDLRHVEADRSGFAAAQHLRVRD